MPFRTKTLAGANAAALAEEMRLEIETALLAVPVWSKVTSAYSGTSPTWIFDVWRNNGTADGYPWYLIVAKHKTLAYCMLSGMLEYDPATFIAKKALRGYNGTGFVDAAGYPLVSAGGAEMTFPLQTFTNTTTSSIGLISGYSVLPTAAATGNWLRVLATDRIVWVGHGTPTALASSHAVGTYQNVFSTTADLKPLAFHVVPVVNGPTTVWQHPSASHINSRANVQASGVASFADGAASGMFGEVGGAIDLLYGGVIGSRIVVQRPGGATKETGTGTDTAGGLLGLTPADLLVFDRAVGCAIGDTITVGGKVYVSITSPAATAGLFVNTQPAV